MVSKTFKSRKGMAATLKNLLMALVVLVVLISLVAYFSSNFRRSIGCEGAADMISSTGAHCNPGSSCPEGSERMSNTILAVVSGGCPKEYVCCSGEKPEDLPEPGEGSIEMEYKKGNEPSEDIIAKSSITVSTGTSVDFTFRGEGDAERCSAEITLPDGSRDRKKSPDTSCTSDVSFSHTFNSPGKHKITVTGYDDNSEPVASYYAYVVAIGEEKESEEDIEEASMEIVLYYKNRLYESKQIALAQGSINDVGPLNQDKADPAIDDTIYYSLFCTKSCVFYFNGQEKASVSSGSKEGTITMEEGMNLIRIDATEGDKSISYQLYYTGSEQGQT